MAEKKVFRCGECGTSHSGARLPKPWKVICGRTLCEKCKNDLYVVRAVEMPVKRPLNLDWKAFDAHVFRFMDAARHLANWGMSLLFSRDVHPIGRDDELQPMPAINLYSELITGKDPDTMARWLAWKGCAATAANVLKAVADLYRQDRRQILCTGERSLRSYRSLLVPLRDDQWKLSRTGDDFVVDLPLPPLRTEAALRVQLALDVARGFDRQTERLKQLLAGTAQPCDAAIYRRRASSGSHRHVVWEKDESGNKRPLRTFIKLVGWFPRQARFSGNNCLTLFTDPECFWVCEKDGSRVWVENGDHVRRAVAGHHESLQRLRQDLKHERRTLKRPQIMNQMLAAMKLRCEKHDNRVSTFVKQSVAAVVGIAERHHACEVKYLDECRSYVHSFPWAIFRLRLKESLESRGVTFTHVAGEDDEAEAVQVG